LPAVVAGGWQRRGLGTVGVLYLMFVRVAG